MSDYDDPGPQFKRISMKYFFDRRAEARLLVQHAEKNDGMIETTIICETKIEVYSSSLDVEVRPYNDATSWCKEPATPRLISPASDG